MNKFTYMNRELFRLTQGVQITEDVLYCFLYALCTVVVLSEIFSFLPSFCSSEVLLYVSSLTCFQIFVVRTVDQEFFVGKMFRQLYFRLVLFSLLWLLDNINLLHLYVVVEGDRQKFLPSRNFPVYGIYKNCTADSWTMWLCLLGLVRSIYSIFAWVVKSMLTNAIVSNLIPLHAGGAVF